MAKEELLITDSPAATQTGSDSVHCWPTHRLSGNPTNASDPRQLYVAKIRSLTISIATLPFLGLSKSGHFTGSRKVI